MESISVFDIFKIGVGPSSSHTMGPWRAAERFLKTCGELGLFDQIVGVQVDLYGSLAKTGRGHGTDFAVILGLAGEDPATCQVAGLQNQVDEIRRGRSIRLAGTREICFDPASEIVFHMAESLPFHPNGLRFTALLDDEAEHSETYYSVGGGFVVQEGESAQGARAVRLPFPIESAGELLGFCRDRTMTIAEVVHGNESAWRTDAEVRDGLDRIWATMVRCVHRGCGASGILPGGLGVIRRAAKMGQDLLGKEPPADPAEWLDLIRCRQWNFRETLKWVSTFALAVNEENAAFGRVVTAPTNGAAGVIPAVMLYLALFCESGETAIHDALLVAGEIGSLFKKGATLSAAMGGCQAEIGVSSAMAAAGLTQGLGGSPAQALMAAEIAMEHHLGLTCDPVGGLVQVPCIERNTMGAIKAITAANLALAGDPTHAKVSLDHAIRSMWATAQDMNVKYKETSEGGLAVLIPVSVSEC